MPSRFHISHQFHGTGGRPVLHCQNGGYVGDKDEPVVSHPTHTFNNRTVLVKMLWDSDPWTLSPDWEIVHHDEEDGIW